MNPRVKIYQAGSESKLQGFDFSIFESGKDALGAKPETRWEVELGFGKGRFLLHSAAEHPKTRFLGVEIAGRYCRMAASRAARKGLGNLLLIHSEARYLLSSSVPKGFAKRVHIYFPDPWPKSKHHRRRLMHPESLDLVLSLLRPDGELLFATDFLAYGALVEKLLRSHPGLEVTRLEEQWPEGAKTNYEAKFIAEGRPILRLVSRLKPELFEASSTLSLFHPDGELGVTSAHAPYEDPADDMEES